MGSGWWFAKSGVAAVLWLSSSGIAAAEGEWPRRVDANDVEPALETSGPWRRLGDSDFRLAWPESGMRPFRFSGDGRLIAGANRQQVRIWRFPSGELVHDLSDAIDSDCIVFSSDGKQLLALEQRQLEIHRFDVATGKTIGKTKVKDFVDEGLAPRFFFSDDGKSLVATAEHVAAWDTATGDRRLWIPMQREGAVAAQGVLLLWGYKFVDRYDLATGKQLSSVRRVGEAGAVMSNATGTVMAGYSEPDRAIVFYDPVKNRAVGGKIPFEVAQDWSWNDAMISADGRRFVT